MRAWACLVGLLLCGNASAGSFSEDEKEFLYSFQILAFSKAWCEDRYTIDLSALMPTRDEIAPSTKDKAFQRILVDAAAFVDDRIQAEGEEKYCAALYDWIGGERGSSSIIKRGPDR